jgi:hypothetical protein
MQSSDEFLADNLACDATLSNKQIKAVYDDLIDRYMAKMVKLYELKSDKLQLITLLDSVVEKNTELLLGDRYMLVLVLACEVVKSACLDDRLRSNACVAICTAMVAVPFYKMTPVWAGYACMVRKYCETLLANQKSIDIPYPCVSRVEAFLRDWIAVKVRPCMRTMLDVAEGREELLRVILYRHDFMYIINDFRFILQKHVGDAKYDQLLIENMEWYASLGYVHRTSNKSISRYGFVYTTNASKVRCSSCPKVISTKDPGTVQCLLCNSIYHNKHIKALRLEYNCHSRQLVKVLTAYCPSCDRCILVHPLVGEENLMSEVKTAILFDEHRSGLLGLDSDQIDELTLSTLSTLDKSTIQTVS